MSSHQPPPRDTWQDWANHVLEELKSLRTDLKEAEAKQLTLLLQVQKLKVEATIWGGIVGGIISIAGKEIFNSLMSK